MPKRKFSSRSRRTKVRDARLIVIATEGRYTEKQYFRALAQSYRNSRIHVEVLSAQEDNKSAPHQVLQRLQKFKKMYSLNQNDELWLVLDIDGWGEKQLGITIRECIKANYYIADSNPAFEIWLLLHLKDMSNYSETEIQAFLDNNKSGKRTFCEQKLLEVVGEHNKSNLKTDLYIPYVAIAVERCEKLDTESDERWLRTAGSRVYKLAKSIIDKS